MDITYWDSSKEVYVEFYDKNETTFSISKVGIQIDMTSPEYYGGAIVYSPVLNTYDLVCLLCLWEEVYGNV